MDLDLDTDVWPAAHGQQRYKAEVDGPGESEIALDERQQLQVDYAQAVARAEQQEYQAQALFELSQNVSVALELDDLRQSIVESLYESMRADTASLFLREEDGKLRMVAQCNIDLTRARIIFQPDEGLVALAAREHRTVYVPNTSVHRQYATTGHDRPRSLLAVPVDPHSGPSYVLCIVRRRLFAFTDDEIQFANLMASVAAHALSNSALYGAMSDLAREQATLYELARASNISDGVSTFIQCAIEPLRSALNASGCIIILLPAGAANTPDRAHTASYGMSTSGMAQCMAFASELAKMREASNVAIRCDVSPDRSRLILAPVLARDMPVAIIGWEILAGSATQIDEGIDIFPGLAVWSASEQLVMDMPSIVLQDTQQGPPYLPLTDTETTFIASVGQQLALGIENLHLRVRGLDAFRSISALPASRPHLNHVRQAIVTEVAKVFSSAAIALILRDETTQEPRVVATSHGMHAGWMQSAIRLAKDTHELRQQRGTVVTALVADNETIGWLAMRLVGTTQLAPDRCLVFTSLAGAAALILRNARLHLMAREAAVDRERQRIAREIHDGVAQNLAHLMLRLELVQRLIDMEPQRAKAEAEGARQVLSTSLNDLRQSIAALAPAQLEELGFVGAVQSLLDDIATNTPDLHVTFTCCPDQQIPLELRAPAFRAVQEALSNIRKHAKAHHCSITVAIDHNDHLKLTVRDDGQGFQPDLEGPSGGHFGLRGMRDRVAEFGGTIAIDSAPGCGTAITLSLPLTMAA